MIPVEAKVASRCIFCGPTTAKLTVEDALPVWTSRVLHARPGSNQYQVHRYKGNRIHGIWSSKDLGIRVRVVCSECNNGWLSNLENYAKPLLTPMIRRVARVTLRLEQRATLATWAFKTAATLEYSGPRSVFFTAEELSTFRDTLLPPADVGIWAAKYAGGRGAHYHGTTHGLTHHTTTPEDFKVRALTFSVGQLAFQVVGIRSKTRGLVRLGRPIIRRVPSGWRTRLVRVWPIETGRDMEWPPDM